MTDLYRLKREIVDLYLDGKNNEANKKNEEYVKALIKLKKEQKSAQKWLHNYSEVKN